MTTPTKTRRKAPVSLRLPDDVRAAVEADARARGVTVNQWLTEAARRRLHPPRPRTGVTDGQTDCPHPRAAWVSQPKGKVDCRVCGTRGLDPAKLTQ